MKKVIMYLGYSILVTLVSYLTYRFILPFVFPFLIAILLAIILEPIILFLNKRLNIKKEYCIIIVLTLITIILITLCYILLYNIFIESIKIVTLLPEFIEKSIYYIDEYVKNIKIHFLSQVDIKTIIEESLNRVLSGALSIVNYIRSVILGTLYSFPKVILFWIVVYVSTYFFLKEKQNYSKLFVSQTNYLSNKVSSMKNRTIQSFNKIIKAQLIIMLFSVIITIIGLKILSVKYAVTIGLICGLLDILPMIGPSLIYIPWVIYLIIVGQTLKAIGLLTIFVLLIIIRQLLQVKLFSNQFKIHPMLMLVSAYIGIKIFGPIGLVLGPLVSIFIKETLKYIPI
ncbi:sporulation integral membrane protein YtvI [Brassicibacter mesophilus]|uniref:sporulation integral membrane protein YtvI n=1 Tax=Brassicibacter mesophilus TaxID=745119 RepID=UPI003D262D22